MMTDSKSDEPEDLIEPLPGKQQLIFSHLSLFYLDSLFSYTLQV